MFSKALALAAGFTQPIIISRKNLSGQCSSSIGAFVIINQDGWIITAKHILEMIEEINQQSAIVKKQIAEVNKINNDASLDKKGRKKALRKLGKLDPNFSEETSILWGDHGQTITNVNLMTDIDLAIGKLTSFNAKLVKNYPTFKDPSQNFNHGTSLCKLGFPFHSIQPIWDVKNKAFALPKGSLPIPRFPIEGILTRIVSVQPSVAVPFPLNYVETSSPGLRGQSGGPTFDSQGTIWAIQSQTANLPLGFDPLVPGKTNGETVHQFLNVGWGVHAATIKGFLDSFKIKYALSKY